MTDGPKIGIMTPTAPDEVLARAHEVTGSTMPAKTMDQLLIERAPPMPPGFFGSVEFVYEHGRMVVVRVIRTMKPVKDTKDGHR